MNEEFKYQGIWWISNQPDKRIPGILTFIPEEGAILDLMGSFRDSPDLENIQKIEIIHGLTSTGVTITLYKCEERTFQIHSPGFLISSYNVNFVFINIHFSKSEDIKFKKVYVHFSHLDEWVSISGIDIDFNPENREVNINFRVPDPITVPVGENYKILIKFEPNFPSLFPVQNEACVKQKAFIGIEFIGEQHFAEYKKMIYLLQIFLTLGVSEPVYPLKIRGFIESSSQPIEICYQTLYRRSVKKLHPLQMLFSYIDIFEKFPIYIKNWFNKANLLSPVYNLYFGVVYNPNMYLEHSFLNLVQAIEAYHRRIMENYELPEEEHRNRINKILENTPEEYKKWLQEKLAYSNEPSLRKRLKYILGKYSNIIGFLNDKKSFIHKVVTTRNYLIHYDKNLEKESLRGIELLKTTQILKTLLEICLLDEIGLETDKIKNLIERKQISWIFDSNENKYLA